MKTRYSQITKLLGGRAYAMISTKSGVVHFATKNDEYRVFCPANRTVIASEKFEGKQPSERWLVEKALKALGN